MAHRYREPVQVRRAPGVSQAPSAFQWRGEWYQVDAVLAIWRLRDRWWVAPVADVLSGTNDAADVLAGDPAPHPSGDPTERVYYRVRCVDPEGEQIFDLYHDTTHGQWVLDRAHD
jgi:uncharacterized protein DUF6504